MRLSHWAGAQPPPISPPLTLQLLSHDPRLLANALGNGAVVETSDGCVMLLLRSPQMLEAPNTFVFPGGHPAPQLVRLGARPRPRLLQLGLSLGLGSSS